MQERFLATSGDQMFAPQDYSVSMAVSLRLFELPVSARKASHEVRLSDKTTLKACDILRMNLVEEPARSMKS